MSEMKFVDFRPRWMHDLTEEDRRILEGTPMTGSPPEPVPTITSRETLTGRVTAIDLVPRTLRLSLEPGQRRVKGTFPLHLQPALLAALGRRVRLAGLVERRDGTPDSIQVLNVEIPDEDS